MELPGLRHFRNEGIFFIFSDPVEALQGEAWVPAIYTDKGWATADGSTLLSGVEAWRYAEETNQGGQENQQGNERVQSRNAKKRQTGTRKRTNSQKS
jgi:hypothetical protein